MKSRLLLPSLAGEELDEGPDLATQLRLYQQFVAASRQINNMWESDRVSFARERRPIVSLEKTFSPSPGMTTGLLRDLMQIVVDRLAPLKELPQQAMKRVITIQDKIASLADRLRKHASFRFSSFMEHAKDKGEKVVSFLALLELVKQRVVKVAQSDMFEDIDIAAHDLDRLADLKPEFI
jgi:segregation and condensation protein A